MQLDIHILTIQPKIYIAKRLAVTDLNINLNDNIVEFYSAGALVQWLKLPGWKVGDRWPSSFKEKNVSSPLTRKYSILWGASVTARPQTARARITNPWS